MLGVRLELMADELPPGFEEMHAGGSLDFLERPATEWAVGTVHFDQSGEALIVAYSHGILSGIGGITAGPVDPGALCVRYRSSGGGREIARALLERALRHTKVVTVDAAMRSERLHSAPSTANCCSLRLLLLATPIILIGSHGSAEQTEPV
jgi:hypothetical protein